jgi:PhoH-like ATPase
VKVIKEFSLWSEWYSDRKVKVSEVGASGFPQSSGVILEGDGATQYGFIDGDYIVPIKDYYPCKIHAKNEEQKIALHILGSESVPLKVLSGVAGSGKTLLACAHALHKFKSRNSKIAKIIIAKSMTPVGKEIGYLKGGMEDKVRPWLGPFYDNFIHCGVPPYEIDSMIASGELEITPITYIQGRSISNAIIIIDEVQNLSLDIVKQIVTRAAEGSELILLGDQTQKFDHRVKDHTLYTLIERGYDSKLVGHIHLGRSLRSPIADWAVENL